MLNGFLELNLLQIFMLFVMTIYILFLIKSFLKILSIKHIIPDSDGLIFECFDKNNNIVSLNIKKKILYYVLSSKLFVNLIELESRSKSHFNQVVDNKEELTKGMSTGLPWIGIILFGISGFVIHPIFFLGFILDSILRQVTFKLTLNLINKYIYSLMVNWHKMSESEKISFKRIFAMSAIALPEVICAVMQVRSFNKANAQMTFIYSKFHYRQSYNYKKDQYLEVDALVENAKVQANSLINEEEKVKSIYE